MASEASGDSATPQPETPSYLRSTEPESGPPCYEIRDSAKKGRHLVATRLIPAGSVICSEPPIVICPNDEEDPTCCLGCCLMLGSSWTSCRGCGGPLCSTTCQTAPLHVTECRLLEQQHFRFREGVAPSRAQLSLLGTLRILLLKGEQADKWRQLEAHLKYQPGADRLYREFPPLRAFPPDEVRRAYGALTVNCFSYSEPTGGRAGTMLMLLPSLMNHCCVPNAHGHSYRPEVAAAGLDSLHGLRRVYVAATDIAADAEIVINYDTSFDFTVARQDSLRQARHFTCECRRCEDPTELGLHCGSICCARCRGSGEMQPLVPDEAGDLSCRWRCPRCNESTPGSVVSHHLMDSEMSYGSAVRSVAGLEDFIKRYQHPRGRLPPTASNILWAKYTLVTTQYGRQPGCMLIDLSVSQLLLVEKHCRDLLKALDICEPGYSLRQGKVRLALSGVLLERVKRSARLPLLPNTKALMVDAEQCLHKAEVALRCNSDMRQQLQARRQNIEDAKKVLSWVAVLPP